MSTTRDFFLVVDVQPCDERASRWRLLIQQRNFLNLVHNLINFDPRRHSNRRQCVFLRHIQHEITWTCSNSGGIHSSLERKENGLEIKCMPNWPWSSMTTTKTMPIRGILQMKLSHQIDGALTGHVKKSDNVQSFPIWRLRSMMGINWFAAPLTPLETWVLGPWVPPTGEVRRSPVRTQDSTIVFLNSPQRCRPWNTKKHTSKKTHLPKTPPPHSKKTPPLRLSPKKKSHTLHKKHPSLPPPSPPKKHTPQPSPSSHQEKHPKKTPSRKQTHTRKNTHTRNSSLPLLTRKNSHTHTPKTGEQCSGLCGKS